MKQEYNYILIIDSDEWRSGHYLGIQVTPEVYDQYEVGDFFTYDKYVPPEAIYPHITNLTMDYDS
ncbi:unnamed protein product [marine sediment metagenome]|uniref:Uncharacterized protein n=1 Tax=marine sediment metagenome TaxID=412755 RepID=X0ZAV2_9ZZZZ